MLALLLAPVLTFALADAGADARCAAMTRSYLETFAADDASNARSSARAMMAFYIGRLSTAHDLAETLAMIEAAQVGFADGTAADVERMAEQCKKDFVAASDGI
jgi:hypothetical protein